MKKGRLLPIIILILLILVAGVFIIRRYSPNNTILSYASYLKLDKDDQYKISLNNNYEDSLAYKVDGKFYIPIDFVNDKIDSVLYYDFTKKKVLLTLPTDIVAMEGRLDGKSAFVNIKDLEKYIPMNVSISTDPNIVTIEHGITKEKIGIAKGEVNIRKLGGIKSVIVGTVSSDSKLVIIDDLEDWLKVRAENGIIGYVKANKLKDINDVEVSYKIEDPKYTHILSDDKILLGWNLITNTTANNIINSLVIKNKGMNIISPTWYSVKNNNGDLRDLSSKNYVDIAHQNGMKVWALLENISHKDAKHREFLKGFDTRKNIIDKLMVSAINNNIDGINLDFEAISVDASLDYIQFIRELSVACRRNNLTLSVDNYVPMNFNKHYDLATQAKFVDYLIIMGYDEHYSGSDAGPVSSFGYVKNGIDNMLKYTDASRVINGIPAYSRVWQFKGKKKVGSVVVNMNEMTQILERHKLKPKWNSDLKENYVEYKSKDGYLCKLWLEDKRSIKAKINYMREKDLAGAALWRLGLEDKAGFNEMKGILN